MARATSLSGAIADTATSASSRPVASARAGRALRGRSSSSAIRRPSSCDGRAIASAASAGWRDDFIERAMSSRCSA
jgi:hypothetical protein